MAGFISAAAKGASHFVNAISLITQPGIRPLVVIPLLLNLVLFGVISYFAIQQLEGWMGYWLAWLPDWEWLGFIRTLIWGLFAGIWLFSYSFLFVMLGNLIAAPFNGLLSEKVEAHITGRPLPETPWKELPAIAGRTILRELQKLLYFIPRAIGVALLCLILSFIPGINILVPFIGFAWGAWWLSMQYIDYPVDNRGQSFRILKQGLKQKPGCGYGFGALAVFASTIPVVNILAMPIAVTGGTTLWIKELNTSAPTQVFKAVG